MKIKNTLINRKRFRVLDVELNLHSFFVSLFNLLKTVSFWFMIVIVLILTRTDLPTFTGMDILLPSIGTVTVVTALMNYLKGVSVDPRHREHYYLGYNINGHVYHNFWVKQFIKVPFRFFLWLVIGIPSLKLVIEYTPNISIVSSIFSFIANHENMLTSIWLSCLIVVGFYFSAMLIETINISISQVRDSKYYKENLSMAEYEIKNIAEKEFKSLFAKLLNSKPNRNHIPQQFTYTTSYIIKRAKLVSESEDDFRSFYFCVYSSERDVISNLINKIESKVLKIDKSKSKLMNKYRIGYVEHFSRVLHDYYLIKWSEWKYELEKYELESTLELCIKMLFLDLKMIYRLAEVTSSNSKTNKIFNTIFLREVSKDDWIRHDVVDCLYNMQCAFEFLITNLEINAIFDNETNTEYRILQVVREFHEIEDLMNSKTEFFSNCLSTMFKIANSEEFSNFKWVISFRKTLIEKRGESSLQNSFRVYAYNQFLICSDKDNTSVEFLLGPLEFDEVLIALIIRLGVANRTHNSIMNEGEYRIWSNKFFDVVNMNDINILLSDELINKVKADINGTNFNHFIFPQFLDWLINSLTIEFGSILYNEFELLYEEGIRRNYSLSSYLVLRSLVATKYSVEKDIHNLEKLNSSSVNRELKIIKKTLSIE